MSCRAVLEFVSMLCVYDMVVSEKVKNTELMSLSNCLMFVLEKKGIFPKESADNKHF